MRAVEPIDVGVQRTYITKRKGKKNIPAGGWGHAMRVHARMLTTAPRGVCKGERTCRVVIIVSKPNKKREHTGTGENHAVGVYT